jgi:hypothetical protein
MNVDPVNAPNEEKEKAFDCIGQLQSSDNGKQVETD